MNTEIRPMTNETEADVLTLRLPHHQQHFIESVSDCLAEAQVETRFVPVGLYVDNTVVGFAMYGRFDDDVWLDRILIDEHFQGRGLGKQFILELIALLRHTYPGLPLLLSVYDYNKDAIRLYEKLGFRFTGGLDDKGELIMQWK